MDERILKWLFDIKIAIEEIDGYFQTEEKDFFKYRQNLMLKRAIERDLEIIGEAKYNDKYLHFFDSLLLTGFLFGGFFYRSK